MATLKVSEKLKNLLNQAIAMEIQVSIQYMWQHIQTAGILHHLIADEFKKIAIEEMKHAESIAERLWYLGEKPTTQPAPITVGENLREMLKQDLKDEEKTIELYRSIIKVAEEEGDVVTRRLFERILEDEERHHDFFMTALEEYERIVTGA